jgi:hypothetical protein
VEPDMMNEKQTETVHDFDAVFFDRMLEIVRDESLSIELVKTAERAIIVEIGHYLSKKNPFMDFEIPKDEKEPPCL